MTSIASRLISAVTLRAMLGGAVTFLGASVIVLSIAVSIRSAAGFDVPNRVLTLVIPSLLGAAFLGVGLAILFRRLRGVSALLCFAGFVASMIPLFVATATLRLLALPLAIVFGYTLIFLLWPERGETADWRQINRPASPTDATWREWLLASLADASLERAPDRFVESALAFSLTVGTTIAFLVLGSSLPEPPNTTTWLIMVIGWGILWYLVALPFVFRLVRFLRQTHARTAEREVLQPGSRRPVLYLRSFEMDRPRHRFRVLEIILMQRPSHEEILARQLRRCGPVIAIGRPNERLPELGAARFYTADDRWQQKIADVVRVSQLVVWMTGTTDGLAWELKHLLATLAPDKLIVWAHPHLLSLNEADRETEWRRFLAALGGLFPKPLPEHLGDARYFYFGPAFEPIPVAPRRRWPWNPQRSAFRVLLAAKDLPRPDPVLRAHRRRALAIGGASAGAFMLTIGGVYGLVGWLPRHLRPLPREATERSGAPQEPPDEPRDGPREASGPLRVLTALLVEADDARPPREILDEYQTMLSWTDRHWKERFDASAEVIDKVRTLLTSYVRIFQLARNEPAIEALLYGRGRRLFNDMRDVKDSAARLTALVPVAKALAQSQADLARTQDWKADEDTPEPSFARRLDVRARLIANEMAILRLLEDNAGAWGIVGIPDFPREDLQDRYVDLANAAIDAHNELQGLLSGGP